MAAIIGQLVSSFVISFFIGTLVLWACSRAVKMEYATLRVAAITSGIMTVLLLMVFLLGLLYFAYFAEPIGRHMASVYYAFFVFAVLVILFIIIKRIYDTSLLASFGLIVPLIAVHVCINKLTKFIFL